MTDRKKLLFISHDATLSGAPILLLNIVKSLYALQQYEIEIVTLASGPLDIEFQKYVSQYYVLDELESKTTKLFNRIHNKFSPIDTSLEKKSELLCTKLIRNKYDLVIGNTIVTLPWILPFKKRGVPSICSIHELTFSIESIFTKQYVTDNIGKIDQIIAGSRSVSENLIARYGAPESIVNVIHSFVTDELTIHKKPEQLKEELGIRQDEFVFGLASSPELRKGTDLVPQLVSKINKLAPDLPFKFINLGGNETNVFVRMAKLDAEKLGVADKIQFVGHTKYPNDYLNIYDVFVMMSREDPFPLVTLTAAKLSKVIIAFQQSGGADEFLEHGAGILVPYLNLEEMAVQIIALAKDAARRKAIGEMARQELDNKYDQHLTMQKIVTLISTVSK